MKFHNYFFTAFSIFISFTLAGCPEDENLLNKGGPASGIAVVNSDYESTSISLLNDDFTLAQSNCLSSGSQTPELSQALSGDVVLASTPKNDKSELVLIDRSNSAIIWLNPVTCSVRAQLAVGTTGSGNFYANPRDVLTLSTTKAYVTRFAQNASYNSEEPDVNDLERGDDILIIDPSTPSIIGHIDLSEIIAAVDNASVLARPAQLMLIDNMVYLTLGRISAFYDTAAPSILIVIDSETDTITDSIELPFLDCEAMAYINEAQNLIIACYGLYSDSQPQSETAGIVAVDISVSPPTIAKSYNYNIFANRTVSGMTVAAMDSDQIFVVVMGNGDDQNDEIWRLSLNNDKVASVFTASGSWQLSSLFADPTTKKLLATDGSMTDPKLRVFSTSDAATCTEVNNLNPDPEHNLPPRQVIKY
ncbi:MAG: hypothetical protein JW841_12050 [Deltaproteobacteria bacterium]|nr:hypothetical protein [Deltaproteobacteria bacterium]